MTHARQYDTPTTLDRLLAAPMFLITLVFLVGVAVTLHMSESEFWKQNGQGILVLLAVLYPLYPLETLLHWFLGGRGLKQNLLFCIIPIARLGARDHADQSRIWLPIMGWQAVTRSLAHRLMRNFGLPMIVIALLVVPVIVFEFFFDEFLLSHRSIKLAVESTSVFIWACFVFEFVIVVSVVDNRSRYCRQNWINLAVIVLPAIAFLRLVRIGRLLALKQLVRTTRVFRLRGILFRAWRAIVTLNVIDMILRRDLSVRLRRTKATLAEKLDEIELLRNEVERLEQTIAARNIKYPTTPTESFSNSTPNSHVHSAIPAVTLPIESAESARDRAPRKG